MFPDSRADFRSVEMKRASSTKDLGKLKPCVTAVQLLARMLTEAPLINPVVN